MTRRFPWRAADLRGATRLATEATAGLTDLVEALHARIGQWPGQAASPTGRTGGITGLVYASIRGVTRVVGGSLDALLGALTPLLAPADAGAAAAPGLPAADPAERAALLAALNGVLGDYLVATGNPLALQMQLKHQGQALSLAAQAGPPTWPQPAGRLLVQVHGLCMHDGQWLRDGHEHGAALACSAGYTPLQVHYNTGLHISLNGRELSRQLQALMARWPAASAPRLSLLGHSMGGLVARSAIHQAQLAGLTWVAQLDSLVTLGTPHLGAPLERAGHGVDLLLGASPYTAPLARLGRLRSAGITDLRHGHLLDEDWAGRDRFARRTQARPWLPLPEGVRCFALATCLGDDVQDLKSRLMGDGLVPVDSALGRQAAPAPSLAFPPDAQAVLPGVSHLGMLGNPAVAGQLQRWLA